MAATHAVVFSGATCNTRRIIAPVDKQEWRPRTLFCRQTRWKQKRKGNLWCCNAAAAANNSDSRPDLWKSGPGYHPLEELSSAEKEEAEKLHAGKLNHGEVARTIAEVNSSAILLAPALSQSNAVYGTEVMYLVDENGEIFFELQDDNDVLHKLSRDPRCSLIIGFGELNELLTTELLPTYENHLAMQQSFDEDEAHDIFVEDAEDDEEDEDEDEDDDDTGDDEEDDEELSTSSSGLPNDAHPMVFASKLSKVAASDPLSGIFKPSMRLALTGVVRSLNDEEESYARRIWEDRFLWEDDEDEEEETSGDEGEEEGEDDDNIESSHAGDTEDPSSETEDDSEDDWEEDSEPETTLYKFEIHSIQLASDIGAHAAVDAKEFRFSEADVLADAAPDIIKKLNSANKRKALKNLCLREKNIEFEEVAVIGVDSLGMDVRASRGIELKTMRFPFARRARCVDTAQTLLHQLLYPRNRHKK